MFGVQYRFRSRPLAKCSSSSSHCLWVRFKHSTLHPILKYLTLTYSQTFYCASYSQTFSSAIFSIILLCSLFSNILKLYSYQNVKDQAPHPYKSKGNIIAPCTARCSTELCPFAHCVFVFHMVHGRSGVYFLLQHSTSGLCRRIADVLHLETGL